MLHVMSFTDEKPIYSMMYPVASCAMSVVPALSGESYVTLPDPGEYAEHESLEKGRGTSQAG